MTIDQDGAPNSGSTASPVSSLGSIQRIDDRTALVLGQELNIEAKQPDVANALVHLAGDTIVVVDTGVTEPFRKALRTVVDQWVTRSGCSC